MGRFAVFPAVDRLSQFSAYWFKPLTVPKGEALPLNGKFSYLPVNLQRSVTTSTSGTRRDNAPIEVLIFKFWVEKCLLREWAQVL